MRESGLCKPGGITGTSKAPSRFYCNKAKGVQGDHPGTAGSHSPQGVWMI